MRFCWNREEDELHIVDRKQGSIDRTHNSNPIVIVFDPDLADRIVTMLNAPYKRPTYRRQH